MQPIRDLRVRQQLVVDHHSSDPLWLWQRQRKLRVRHRLRVLRFALHGTGAAGWPLLFETVKKPRNRVGIQSSRGSVKGAKSPLRVQSTSFSNFFKVRKTVSAGRKDFFDTLNRSGRMAAPVCQCVSLYFRIPSASRSIARSRSSCFSTYAMRISLRPLPGVA